jgi:glutamate formiminotransferase
MVPVLEAVPNFSAGRDPSLLQRLVRAVTDAGAEVLDRSTDADHNRAVLTFVGAPDVVEEAAVACARLATEAIDLRGHRGAHPRVGALDVLPFVPLVGLSLDDARASARRVGERLAREIGLPVFYYAEASEPRGRRLSELRRGGFETLVGGFPPDRIPDVLPEAWSHPGVHPTAGAVCVGARPLLLAWNVEVEGLTRDRFERIAQELRESGGGFRGLRTLALILGGSARMQLSMNLEDVEAQHPGRVFRTIEARVREEGGRVTHTEVVGLLPDRLLLETGADRMSLLEPDPRRLLSARLVEHLSSRAHREVEALLEVVREAGAAVPAEVGVAARRLERTLGTSKSTGAGP